VQNGRTPLGIETEFGWKGQYLISQVEGGGVGKEGKKGGVDRSTSSHPVIVVTEKGKSNKKREAP